MIQAYPKYKQETRGKTSQWAKRIKKLKNRLFAGQNWNISQKRFGIGILVLVAVGSDVGFSNTLIETLPQVSFSKIFDLLEKERGDLVHQMSKMVSEGIYDILFGKPSAPVFVLEEEEERLQDVPYDSPALVKRCMLKSSPYQET